MKTIKSLAHYQIGIGKLKCDHKTDKSVQSRSNIGVIKTIWQLEQNARNDIIRVISELVDNNKIDFEVETDR